jgi:hypothetical protein
MSEPSLRYDTHSRTQVCKDPKQASFIALLESDILTHKRRDAMKDQKSRSETSIGRTVCTPEDIFVSTRCVQINHFIIPRSELKDNGRTAPDKEEVLGILASTGKRHRAKIRTQDFEILYIER